MKYSILQFRENCISLRIAIILFLAFYNSSSFSQSWNLVWREDFGVAEDTTLKDFPDISMTVPNHTFACKTDQCGTIDDGYYGIANSTWWAYNRKKECNKSAGHFIAGRDHTGNEKGAMLIVNSGAGKGESIYEQTINFDLCDSRKYRFCVYTASITSYENMQPANFTLRIVNQKTGDVIDSLATGAIPFWSMNGWGNSDGGASDVFAEREWTEYSIEFTANDGDKLSLQVTNWGTGDGGGNDFVIDDISLYRHDDQGVPDPEISTNTISQENSSSADGCIYMAGFSVPSDVLTTWEGIYKKVYFLWQKSVDDGLTWQNVLDVSGIGATKVTMEVSADETAVYRVIITGGTTDAIAQEQALYIAEYGGPKDGCAYFSISNTLAGVRPEPDCTFKANLKTIWKDDFGVIDSFSVKSGDGAAMNFYDTPIEGGFSNGYYALTCAPDSALLKLSISWDEKKSYYSTESALSDYSGATNGAMMYTRFGKATGTIENDMIYNKTVSGPFCNCKTFLFSFFLKNHSSWTTTKLIAQVTDDDNNILGYENITINGSGSYNWEQYAISFNITKGYSGKIHLQIINNSENGWNVMAFDNFSLAICGESIPQGSIKIDDDASLNYLGNFDCSEEPFHKINLNNTSEWVSEYPGYGHAWQYSKDGGSTWIFLSTDASIEYQNEDGGLIEYRAIYAESKEIAEQVAQNGIPDDPCSLYSYSNVVGLNCKLSGCKAPTYQLSTQDTITICNDTTQNVTIEVTQINKVNVDNTQWYSSPAGYGIWTEVTDGAKESLSILPSDSTDYLFIARNDTCFSDSLFVRINVNKAIILKQIADTTLCENGNITIEATVLNGKPTHFIWDSIPSISAEYSITEINKTQNITLKATDGICNSIEQSFIISKEDSVRVNIQSSEEEICFGTEITVNTITPISDNSKTYTFTKETNNVLEKIEGTEITENPKTTTIYTILGESKHCPSAKAKITVQVKEIPSAPDGTKKVTYLKSDAENGTFKDLLSQNPNAINIENGYSYTWYNAEQNKLTETPTPGVPAEGITEDITYTYFVERTSEYGCTSEKTEVSVIIYSAPAPITTDTEYCLNETAEQLTATISVSAENEESDFELIWYPDLTSEALTTAPTPSTEIAGESTYYVSQRNKTTQAESKRIPLKVTVYNVGTPIADNTLISYCKNEIANKLEATISGNGDTLIWTLNGEVTSDNSINTNVDATTVYEYKAHQTYTLQNGKTCEGENIDVSVTVTYVNEPQGDYTVNYIRIEAENNGGTFEKSLIDQNTAVAMADTNCELIWYDEQRNLIGTTAPTPVYDASWPAGNDIIIKYNVAQKDKNTGCISEMHEVTVTISDSPMPKVSTLNYCVNGMPKTENFGNDLVSVTEIQTVIGGDNENAYELVWFTSATEYKTNPEAGTATPTLIPNTSTAGIQKFYVCQRNINNQAMSSPSEITVTIHKNPEIVTKEIPSQCSYDNAIVNIDLNNGLDKTNDILNYTATFYSDASAANTISASVSNTGSYYVQGVYSPVPELFCFSETKEINIDIQDLSTPQIIADETVCPGSNIKLSAQSESNNPGNQIFYTWSCDKTDILNTINGNEITTNNLSETKGTTYDFKVTASSGVCTSESSIHKVSVGEAPLVGNLTIKENGIDDNVAVFSSQSGNEIYTCGGELSLEANFETTEGDYSWSTGAIGATTTISQPEGEKTYKVEFINKCPTFIEFTVHAIPLTLISEPTDFEGCEGSSLNKEIAINCSENNYSVEWTTPSGITTGTGSSALSYSINTTSTTDTGTYTYKVTNRNCSITGSFEAKIKEYIKVNETSEPYIVTRGESQNIILDIINGTPNSIEWKENDNIINSGISYTIQNVTKDHTFNIKLSDPNYCETQTSISVWVDALISLNIDLADSLCFGETETILIDTTGTGNFRKTGIDAVLTITEQTTDGYSSDLSNQIYADNGMLKVDISPKSNATYTVNYTYDSQNKKESESIIVLEPITINPTIEQSVCSGEEITITASVSPSESSVKWDTDNTITSSLEGTSISANPIFKTGENTHQSIHIYNFTATYAFCNPKKGSVKVYVDDPITNGKIEGENIICEGKSTMLSAKSFEATQYLWNNGSTNAQIKVSPEMTTIYNVEMERGKCKAEAEYEVIVNSNPVILSIDSIGIRSRYITTETEKGTEPFYYWIDNNEMDINPEKKDLKFTKHTAYIQDAIGCTTQMDFMMKAPEISIQIVFTPNGDGINDTWSAGNLTDLYPNAIINIFDRNGKLLLKSKASDTSWDGTYNGKAMPSTDYWYEIDIDEIDKQYIGHFTLLR